MIMELPALIRKTTKLTIQTPLDNTGLGASNLVTSY